MKLLNLFNIFKKKDDFKEMSKKEKKNFLSNDFIERMIRVEQRVQSSFGEHIPYNKTKYYESLTKREKENFKKYLKNKKKKKPFLIIPLFLAIVLALFFRVEFTGNVVKEKVGETSFSLFSNFFILFILGNFLIFLAIFILKKKKKKRFEENFKIIDKVALNKYFQNKKDKEGFF